MLTVNILIILYFPLNEEYYCPIILLYLENTISYRYNSDAYVNSLIDKTSSGHQCMGVRTVSTLI
jgi:hypothetical protein